jgi:hypothetical protein
MKKYLILFLIALAACGNTSDPTSSNDQTVQQPGAPVPSPAVPPVPAVPPETNLPAPALNSAELTLGGARHTLTHNLGCRQDGLGIRLQVAGVGLPAIILMKPDFSAAGPVLLETNQGWSMMFDENVAGANVNWGTPVGCQGWAIGNDPNFFELQVANCPLQDHPTAPTRNTSVTFRLRCNR